MPSKLPMACFQLLEVPCDISLSWAEFFPICTIPRTTETFKLKTSQMTSQNKFQLLSALEYKFVTLASRYP